MICALTSSAARGEIEIPCPALPENTPVASDETETYKVEARLYGQTNWSIQIGTTSSTSISCSGVFSTNKSYEWRVISRNSCYENGYLPSTAPVWRFVTCSGSPCP